MQKLLKEILQDEKSLKIIVKALDHYEKYQRYDANHLKDSIQWNNYNDVSVISKYVEELKKYCDHIEYIFDEFQQYLSDKKVKNVNKIN